ncbi:MAG: acyltransferase [Alistipes sp.]|nr:acyltransferase [Alistipes sp.]
MMDPQRIFTLTSEEEFRRTALDVFHFQATACAPYRAYMECLEVRPEEVTTLEQIPFLPVSLFKSQEIYCGTQPPQKIFTSSATTGQTPSRHLVAGLHLYEEAFIQSFERFYGPRDRVALFALLPNYLEREGSSLIYMVDRLIRDGAGGGFYLYDHEALLRELHASTAPVKILLGVSYALWDLAEQHPTDLHDVLIMETGGMKGHRQELSKAAFHRLLCQAFHVERIHSEYGMAELMSQAYSQGEGWFSTPPWMRVMLRDLNDPFALLPTGRTGGVNLIDLANLYSCAFLQTEDLGATDAQGRFQILGRIAGSEIRGCNLLVDHEPDASPHL